MHYYFELYMHKQHSYAACDGALAASIIIMLLIIVFD